MTGSNEKKFLAVQSEYGDLGQLLFKFTVALETLQQTLKEINTPQIPIEHRLWGLEHISSYLNRGRTASLKITAVVGFPEPVQLPSTGESDRSHKQWLAQEVIAWAKSYRRDKIKKVGRPRSY